jgi:hypothetical protein
MKTGQAWKGRNSMSNVLLPAPIRASYDHHLLLDNHASVYLNDVRSEGMRRRNAQVERARVRTSNADNLLGRLKSWTHVIGSPR